MRSADTAVKNKTFDIVETFYMEGNEIMKKQKMAALLLTGVMVLGMTGCGNSKAKAYSKYVELGQYKGIEYTKTVKEVTEQDIQDRAPAAIFLFNANPRQSLPESPPIQNVAEAEIEEKQCLRCRKYTKKR